jgi:hypothetical protein
MSGLPTPRHGSGASRTGHAMQSGRQQGQLAGCVVARGAVHDAMASIAARAARRAASKSSMSGAIASTIALATRSTYSGAARIAGSLSATCAQNVPKAALQRPAKGPRLAARAHRPPGTAAPRSATGRSVRPGRGFGPHPVLRGLVEARAEGEGEMTRWLNFGTAALAFAAAVFCFVGLREASRVTGLSGQDARGRSVLHGADRFCENEQNSRLVQRTFSSLRRCECIAAACLIWLKIHPFRGALGARPALHRPPTARIAALRFDDRGLNLWKVAG